MSKDQFFKYLPAITSLLMLFVAGMGFFRERKLAAMAADEHDLKKELLALQVSSLKQNLPV